MYIYRQKEREKEKKKEGKKKRISIYKSTYVACVYVCMCIYIYLYTRDSYTDAMYVIYILIHRKLMTRGAYQNATLILTSTICTLTLQSIIGLMKELHYHSYLDLYLKFMRSSSASVFTTSRLRNDREYNFNFRYIVSILHRQNFMSCPF